MAMTDKPALVGQTKENNTKGVTDVSLVAQREVTYVFKATSSSNLNIPYAVAVNAKTLAAYDKKPSRVSGKSGKFTTIVNRGDKVSLYLNSDAHPSYRKNAVYEVTVGDRDIVVTVTEKSGKHSDSDKPSLITSKSTEKPPTVDNYTAPLTGDIWMKVSHKYASSEVDALMPQGTSLEAIAAIKSIYDGLAKATLNVNIVAKGAQSAKSLTVTFDDSNNPKENIAAYNLLADGLPRVHPGGYAALLNAALDNDITTLTVSSCWRPMLGSIAHRAGLGLDVNFVGKTRMNRQELRSAFEGKNPSKKGDADDADNVTSAEVTAFGEYEQAIVDAKKARAMSDAAKRALDTAKKSGNTDAVAIAQKASDEKALAAREAATAEAAKNKAWNNERDAGEPANTRLFRASLLKCSCVTQLFDPWFMDANTKDQVDPEPNMQRGPSTGNERLHSHHLHITVHEPKIL